jgi:Arc/MetJ-type ribon-helix-helix transcriptional regulator
MVKVMITIQEEFLEKIDQAAAMEHRSRSEYIREAVREHLDRPRPTHGSLLHKPNVQWALQVQARASRKRHNPKFNSVAFIRKLRGPLK